MDALDILTNLDRVFPYFQPIFSADEQRVIGYETLGRYIHNGQLTSLGPFFQDRNIPEEYRLEVDNIVLAKALEQAESLDKEIQIFVNREAELLLYDNGESFLQLLLRFQERGIALERIVIEIAAEDPKYNEIIHLMNYFRTYGIKIALDKMGDDGSHLDRIGQLQPDIVKVDLLPLRSIDPSPVYRDILYSLSVLARKIGATLLFKNIEMLYQLQFAWKHGGRFYQGYYLGKPSADFIATDLLKNKLKKEFHEFILSEKKKLKAVYDISEKLQERMQQLLGKSRKSSDYNEMMEMLAKDLDQMAFRMYICDEDGFQKTANMFKKDEQWMIQPEYYGKNWSWRPYFLEDIFKMRREKKGILSDLYRDLETGELIRTFSYPINTEEYLFIDLSYEFLYQHGGLL